MSETHKHNITGANNCKIYHEEIIIALSFNKIQ